MRLICVFNKRNIEMEVKMLYTTITEQKRYRQSFAKDPAVVRLKDTYYLYYSIYLEDEQKFSIGIAKSSDMETWEFIGDFPLTQECEKNGACAPGAYVENGIVHLFYQTYGNWQKDSICHATSKDGVHFEKDESNPIFRPTNDWCVGRAIDADVVAFKDKLFLYFATRDYEMKIQQIGVATATLNGNYAKSQWTQAVNKSIVYPEEAWEGECIEAPATIVHDNKVYLFYGGAYNCSPQQIGYAVSEDGIHFEKPEKVPFIPCGKKGEWNESESGHPYLFQDDDGKTYIFYQGSPDMGKSWYLSKYQTAFKEGKPYIIND